MTILVLGYIFKVWILLINRISKIITNDNQIISYRNITVLPYINLLETLIFHSL